MRTLSEISVKSKIKKLAGSMDTKSRQFAKWLHDVRVLYTLFGALDGLNMSYGALKNWFDVVCSNSNISSSDAMHEWMLTPEGIAFTATESITLIGFAMLANHFDDGDKNRLKRFIAVSFPYFRDAAKASRNSFKGMRSLWQLTNSVSGVNLNAYLVPAALFLGALSILNRLWMRSMINDRKAMMKANDDLLFDIHAYPGLTAEKAQELRNRIKKQSKAERGVAFLSATYGGIVDSLYLYVGVFSVCSLIPPALIVVAVLSAIYTLACIATRLYEEYDYQRKLWITQAKVEFALAGKEIEYDFKALHELSLKLLNDPENDNLLKAKRDLLEKIKKKAIIFEKCHKELRDLQTNSYLSASLAGMKNGLAAYGAVSSMIFAVGTILALASVAFPPALLITCVGLGLACLIGFMGYTLYQTYRQRQKEALEAHPADEQLFMVLAVLNQVEEQMNELEPQEIGQALVESTNSNPTTQLFQEWFEVIRSFFSGVSKGSKSVDYAFNPLQELGADGHYHDTSPMFFIVGASVLLHSFILALRAYARGFGRPPLVGNNNEAVKKQEHEKEQGEPTLPPEPLSVKESACELDQRPDSAPKRSNSLFGLYDLFSSKTRSRPSSPHIGRHKENEDSLSEDDSNNDNSFFEESDDSMEEYSFA